MSSRAACATVRMYNVGFGDCFLLTLPESDRPRKVLIDCGSHSHGKGPKPIGEVVARLLEDIDEGGRKRIDVVVATHRHQDHVSGFESDLWDDVEVGEVWLPWTEDPQDVEARRILERQSRAARSLQRAALSFKESNPFRASALALAENSLTNARAMATLHRGFAGHPLRRYLPSQSSQNRTFKSDCLPLGVKVHVLGPSRDPEVIRDMDPPRDERYLRLAMEPETSGQERAALFASRWTMSQEELKRIPSFSHLAAVKTRQLRKIQRFSRIDSQETLQLAVQLEKAINGTSLVLIFEVGKACLLFPGDAQWGTWRVALADTEWRDLLARTSFFKIGHHGSHNATPKDLVEHVLPEGLAAMVSTRKVSNWPDIPRAPLLEALSKKSTRGLVRSDDPPSELPDAFSRVDDLCMELKVPL
ncbi:MAG TPA: MBL fold metallo-hydrolase [Thermoanaerobaculia bacterium]|nr:MBL fold metallo-hydrolase [Thermoanaerobaculia bacterium]